MKVTIAPWVPGGSIPAIPSKSCVHRLLICMALGDRPSSLTCDLISDDMTATARCLSALGAGSSVGDGVISISPVAPVAGPVVLDPGESGSTYRFLAPVASALGRNATFALHGRLPSRPMEALWSQMELHGVTVSGKGTASPRLEGRLTPGTFRLPGDLSSQFFSGLMFALPTLDGDSRIVTEGKLESAGYVQMTIDALESFGVRVIRDGNDFVVPGNQRYVVPDGLTAEGDWSNSAFWLCAAAARGSVEVSGLRVRTSQGDSAVLELLRRFGADVAVEGDRVRVTSRPLRGITASVGDTPDLVPALAVAAAAADGVTRFTDAGRLRLKESDRIASVCGALSSLGCDVESDADSITVRGGKRLSGGVVDSCGDHRIAMLGSALSCLCDGPVTVVGAGAVAKSYPRFYEDFERLGASVMKDPAATDTTAAGELEKGATSGYSTTKTGGAAVDKASAISGTAGSVGMAARGAAGKEVSA